MEERGLILPPGVLVDDAPTVGPPGGPGTVVIDNRTDLPAGLVEQAVQDYFVENASLAWGHQSTFQTYANEGGSLLARTRFQVPTDVFGEIKLARDIADHDDDVRSAIGGMLAIAFGEGMENFHEDEQTVSLFNEVARNANLDHIFNEIYREFLISQQVTTVSLFTRERFTYTLTGPNDSDTDHEERMAAPLIGILPAEHIRIIDNDLFGRGAVAYLPHEEKLRRWLEEFFGDRTTAARKAEMARQDPVAAALFVERVKTEERTSLIASGQWVYRMNPRMAHRFTAPKGAKAYPRPLLTANFALIEAKRLLNVMDYALLQGGANFIVVAKKGTDDRPATPEEVVNLGQVVARASRTGVIVGDHRLSFEIITPKLEELFNSEKRRLIGRKLASLLLRIPEPSDNGGGEAQKTWDRFVEHVVTADRHACKRHVEASTYYETAKRNVRLFKRGPAKLWFRKIVVGDQAPFFDMILKLRDRGDISRRTTVEVAGLAWEAEVSQREREIEAGHDEIMAPAAVPFDAPGNHPGALPSDGGGQGRPPGARTGGPGQDPRAPRRPVPRGNGEPVRAIWDEETAESVRIGEVTYRLLEAYPDRTDGRITSVEREALTTGEIAQVGPVTVIPVNQVITTVDERVLRLAPGLGMVIGYRRRDGAIVAKALSFRQPEFDDVAAEEFLLNAGYGREKPELPSPDGG